MRVCGHSQVCKHSVTVVASIRYPSHRRHVMWAFMSHSLIFLVSISGFWRTNEVGGKKSQKTKQMIQIDYKDKAVQSIRSSLFSSGIHVLSNSLSLVLFRTKQRVTKTDPESQKFTIHHPDHTCRSECSIEVIYTAFRSTPEEDIRFVFVSFTYGTSSTRTLRLLKLIWLH